MSVTAHERDAQPTLPTYEDVLMAAGRLSGVAHRTPVLTSRTADARAGAQLFFKAENFQRTGSFKFRGAYNAVAALSPEERRRGVVAFSSGNHGQALARSGSLLGAPVVVIMPDDAPEIKKTATRGYGAEVITYDRFADSREEIGRRLASERGLTLIPPYDHDHVLAGQGTAVKELIEDVGPLDRIYVCLGGGGLLSGSLLSAGALAPDCLVYGVEPEAGDDGRQSFRKGEIVRIDVPKTIADGAMTAFLGARTFPIIKRHARDIVTVSDEALIAEMRFFAERMKIVVEPTGCLAAAAAMAAGEAMSGQRVGVILSGGNVDLARFAGFIAGDRNSGRNGVDEGGVHGYKPALTGRVRLGVHVLSGSAHSSRSLSAGSDRALESVTAQIEGLSGALTRAALYDLLPAGAARNAVDCALWDLEAKRTGRRVWELAGLPKPGPEVTAYTLSLAEPAEMEAQAAKHAFRPLLKIKLGTPDDMPRLEAVRRGAPKSTIIVDANEGWSAAVYADLAPHLVRLGVALVEQPLPASEDEALIGMDRPVPVCADESCHDRASLPHLAGKYDVVNIKLDKTGGLTEALALRDAAVAQGFKVMVGCMVGSSLAMAPATLVAQGAMVTDLDGPLLLAEDRATPLRFDEAGVHPPEPGLWG